MLDELPFNQPLNNVLFSYKHQYITTCSDSNNMIYNKNVNERSTLLESPEE
jgi:hypothetical protein